MVTEVAENIYRIGIPLPENPLRELNSYFVRGAQGKRNLLVDTGFRRPECREVLLDGVWGFDFAGETNAVDVYIRFLRSKIDEAFDVKLIHTVRGVGYVIREEEEA